MNTSAVEMEQLRRGNFEYYANKIIFEFVTKTAKNIDDINELTICIPI